MHEAWEAGDDFQLPMNRVEDALDTEGLQQASLEAPIPASNRGYAMLQRMGWSAGRGLGASEDGACFSGPFHLTLVQAAGANFSECKGAQSVSKHSVSNCCDATAHR